MFLTGTSAYAQNTFKARIIDAEENEPLPGATLKISSFQGAVADLNGYVEITDISDDTIQIGRAHVWTPVTDVSRMPSSAWKKKNS